MLLNPVNQVNQKLLIRAFPVFFRGTDLVPIIMDVSDRCYIQAIHRVRDQRSELLRPAAVTHRGLLIIRQTPVSLRCFEFHNILLNEPHKPDQDLRQFCKKLRQSIRL